MGREIEGGTLAVLAMILAATVVIHYLTPAPRWETPRQPQEVETAAEGITERTGPCEGRMVLPGSVIPKVYVDEACLTLQQEERNRRRAETARKRVEQILGKEVR